MTSSTWNKLVNHNGTIVSNSSLPESHADRDQAKSAFVDFDHIDGETESDRLQVFSNLLKAASYLGLDLNKIDFHRQDQ